MSQSFDLVRSKLFVIGSFVEAHCWLVARAPSNDESQHATAYVRECVRVKGWQWRWVHIGWVRLWIC